MVLDFRLEKSLEGDLPALQHWRVVATAHDWGNLDEHDEPTTENVGVFELVKADLLDPSLWSQLEATSGDLETVASAVLDPAGDLHENLDLDGGGSSLLILDRATISDSWRGFGVGAYLAGEILLVLESDASCIATVPAPLDMSEGKARERAVAKLERTWRGLGFEQFREGVMVLDPSLVVLGDAVERMRDNFGVSQA